jgi:hypothetical protein
MVFHLPLSEPLLVGEFGGSIDKSCDQKFYQNTYPSNIQNLSLVRCLPKIHFKNEILTSEGLPFLIPAQHWIELAIIFF